jgi:hypothetical protein
MRALLISTYDLGRQSFGLASAAAALEAHGIDVTCLDLSKQPFDGAAAASAGFIAFYLPMHTATRLAQPVIDHVRALNPAARLCAYGLYAPLNAPLLRDRGIVDILGGEFEDELAACALGSTVPAQLPSGSLAVPRVQFRVPVRTSLPPLARYATLRVGNEARVVGATEASRGCKHRCRHCPIVPVYDGRFRIVPLPVVMADIQAQVDAGAQHISFGDPDFLNGVRHATDLVRAFAAAHPTLTYDVVIKIEHLLKHADLLPLLRDTGCLFVTSAVESVDDAVLLKLEKGHTRADFERVAALCREAGLPLVPTFVPFTPWTTVQGYCELLQAIDSLGLVEHVSPIQLAIRLLIPGGSRLLELEEIRQAIGPFSPGALAYPWRAADSAVDALQETVEQIVGRQSAGRAEMFAAIWNAAHAAAGIEARSPRVPAADGLAIPRMSEPWYCCAEPTSEQAARLL